MTSSIPIELAADGRSDFQRSHEIRAAATAAIFKTDSELKLMRAGDARTRATQFRDHGDWVMVHRANRLQRKWKEGPAVVVLSSGASLWVVLRGSLCKVARCNCTKATNEEKDGIELVEKYLPELREELLGRRRRRD